MLIGPTGSGKTLLGRTCANILNVPFIISDATSLTEAGYVGEDVSSILSRLLERSSYDLGKAQKGIVFLDEVDKLAGHKTNRDSGRDVGGVGVQQALLKLLEGSKVKFQIGNENIEFDTRNVLFILSGAFPNLVESENSSQVLMVYF